MSEIKELFCSNRNLADFEYYFVSPNNLHVDLSVPIVNEKSYSARNNCSKIYVLTTDINTLMKKV